MKRIKTRIEDFIKESNSSYESELLDESKALNALIDGFTIIFGNRDFIKKIGTECFEIGKVNGLDLTHDTILSSYDLESVFRDSFIDKGKVEEIRNDLKNYLPDNIISRLGEEIKTPHEHLYVKGLKKLQSEFVGKISEEEVVVNRYPTPFDYFKSFNLSNEGRFKSVTMYSSILQLDQYTPNNLKYYKEDGELCYFIENFVLKFHYLGMLITKQNFLLSFIEKVEKNLSENNNIDNYMGSILSGIIKQLSLDSITDKIIISIQNKTGVTVDSGFATSTQIRQRISEMAKKLPYKELTEEEKSSNSKKLKDALNKFRDKNFPKT